MNISLIIAITTLYNITAAVIFTVVMYNMRRDLWRWGLPTVLMFATGLAMLCLLWPLVIIIGLISHACARRKGGTND